jgi:hypothetical protein
MWTYINTALYRLYYGYRGRKLRTRGRAIQPPDRQITGGDPLPVLYVAWGRIGDLLLATGHIKHLRRWFHPHPIWLLGRPEVETLVKPYVDVFVPLNEDDILSQDAGSYDQLIRLLRPFKTIIADIHTFYGGVFVIGPLLEQLDACQKIIYEGYNLEMGLAPVRPYPSGFEIVSRKKDPVTDDSDITTRHVLHHMAYYIREVLKRSGIPLGPNEDLQPEITNAELEEYVCQKFKLDPGHFIAWQPVSNNPKKDYPLSRWLDVIATFPDQTFVALGTKQEQERLAGISAPNLINLCGQTTLDETIQLIQHAHMFLGLDSGLSHMATILRKETVCVSQNSNLGYFFPYPPAYGFTNQHTVFHPDYVHCSGCFMICRHESLLSTYRKGALCLRSLPVEQVVANIKGVLS